MGKSKSIENDGINSSNKTQELEQLEKFRNLPFGFYKDGVYER